MHKRLATAAVVGAFAPLLWEWFHYGSDISRLGYVLVCPLLAFVLAWEARTLRRSPQPAPAAAGIAILFAGGLLLLGTIQGMFTIALAGFPVAVAGLLLRQGGWPEFQRLRWSLLCLAAMVPPPLPILDRLIPPLI